MLGWFTETENAHWLYGDLLEEGGNRGRLWFAVHYPRTLVELFWHTLKSHALQVIGIAVAAQACGYLIQLVFYTLSQYSMPITAFAFPAFMGRNLLVTFLLLKLYEAFGFFLTGLLLGLLSRHSAAGILFHFFTWGLFWLTNYTYDWIGGLYPTEMYGLLALQFPIWYGAMLAGSRMTHKARTRTSPPRPGTGG